MSETIHGAFLRAAAENADRIAVSDAAGSLTYAELAGRARSIAQRLVAEGVRPGERVGIYLDRTVDLVAGVLGVLQSGAAFVPLDPEFPAERVRLMVDDAAVRVVVTDSLNAASAPGAVLLNVHGLDVPPAVELPVGTGEDTAYVIYTSGSTGRPKGVRVAHASVMNLLRSVAAEPGIARDDVWLAVTTLSFDISNLELLGPLVAGAQTRVASRDEVLDGRLLARALETSGATIMQATPVAWRVLLEAGWPGDPNLKALCGGEALPPDLATTLVSRTASLWNMYGPTETTIWSTCYRVPESGSPVLIGKPVANTTIYVLDRALRALPAGVPGEIWIGGAGVALGYHERDDLTAERFVPDPFSTVPGARMYRTGDHGRLLRDGNLEYRSRADDQVKIRGFRVELGEIEAAIVDGAAVKQAAVVVRKGEGGDDRLIAYVVPNGGAPSVDAIRARLRERLPAYMVPQHFIETTALPVTPNGKIDRRALEARAGALPAAAHEYVAPRTNAEQLVASVVAEILRLDRVSADADFFDLGGHSVLAMRVVARLRETGAPELTLRDLFEGSTVSAIARRIELQADAAQGGPEDIREILVI